MKNKLPKTDAPTAPAKGKKVAAKKTAKKTAAKRSIKKTADAGYSQI
ncbi:MAG: hypothetical protein ACRC2H_01175 [Silanimonas sp.]